MRILLKRGWRPESTVDAALNVLAPLIGEDLLSSIKPVLEDITQPAAAGTAG